MVRRAQSEGAPFDLVLMDMQMPVSTGWARRRSGGVSDRSLPSLPSANAPPTTSDLVRDADHLAKPLRLGDRPDRGEMVGDRPAAAPAALQGGSKTNPPTMFEVACRFAAMDREPIGILSTRRRGPKSPGCCTRSRASPPISTRRSSASSARDEAIAGLHGRWRKPSSLKSPAN